MTRVAAARRPLLMVLLALLLAPLLMAQTAKTAEAAALFAPIPPPVTLPSGLAVGSGLTVDTIGTTATVGGVAGAGTTVAATGVAAAAATAVGVTAAGLLLGYGLYKGGSWAYQAAYKANEDAIPPGATADFGSCGYWQNTGGGANVTGCSLGTNQQPSRLLTVTANSSVIWFHRANKTGGGFEWRRTTGTSPTGGVTNYSDAEDGFTDGTLQAVRVKFYSYTGTWAGASSSVCSPLPDVNGQPVLTGCTTTTLSPLGEFTSQQFVPQANYNPARQLISTGTCVLVSTGAETPVTASSAVFYETDTTLPALPQVVCPDGQRLEKLLVKEDALDASTPDRILIDWTAPATWKDTGNPDYGCLWGATTPCVLDLKVKLADGTKVSCFDKPELCTEWDTQPDRDTKFECWWGGILKTLQDCAMYRKIFVVTQDQTTTNNYYNFTEVLPPPSTDGNVDPSGDTPGLDNGCVPKWWDALTPWGIAKAAGCVLKWAFVPRAAVLQDYSTRVKTTFEDSAPGKWVGAIDQVKTNLGTASESGCMGPAINWDKLPGGVMYPFKACDGVMATAAQVTKLLATIAVALFGGLACLRALGSGLGWNPGVGEKT